MDIRRSRTNRKRNTRLFGFIAIVATVVFLALTAWDFSRRPPGIARELVYWDEVRRGEFLQLVTARGKLHAPEIRAVTTRSEGIVERVNVLPGHKVGPDDVLVVITNPNLLEELADARAEYESVLAEEELRQSIAADQLLRLESDLADAEDSYDEAQYRAASSRRLNEDGLVIESELIRDINLANRARRRRDIALQLLNNFPEKLAAEEAQALSAVDRQRRKVERLQDRVLGLNVRADFDGVVQDVSIEVGQRLTSGSEVARVMNPHYLIARVRVSERDEPLIEIGQEVRVEVGREHFTGEVSRKDPAAASGFVTIDVEFVDEATHGLRPDVSVVARIQIERVRDSLLVNKPAYIHDGYQQAQMFRLDKSGNRAELVNVEIGRISVREVEILSGVTSGDRILQSDMTEWLGESVVGLR